MPLSIMLGGLMDHDPLCVLSQPCDDETPEHGYCGFSAPNFCIHCHQWCMCGEVRQAEQRMLAKCIAAVENLPDWALNIDDVIEALRALGGSDE
jgi:hypothetical protein